MISAGCLGMFVALNAVAEELAKDSAKDLIPSDTISLEPQIRATPLVSAIPAISLDAIQGFLVQHRVVEPVLFEAAPYVIDGENKRLILGAGDKIYVRGSLGDQESFSLVRQGPLYIDPQTGEVLGREATYLGRASAVAQDGDIATMQVNSSRQEIQLGDRVLPIERHRVDANFFPSSPDGTVRGEIIAVVGGMRHVGQYDIVVLNRGEREALAVGNVLAIYKKTALAQDRIAKQTIQLPSERAGLLMVFRTFEKLSYGIVLTAERPLAVRDEIRNP